MVILFFCFGRDQYVLYQGKRVGEVDDDRLKFEVSTIVSREVISFLNFILNLQRIGLLLNLLCLLGKNH
jgi:hypothetical protein